ncbi:Crp/Fnr family transcriptional regulator [Roseisolibacter agri]|uniref:Cyclic nucleotide-binding protein n=1 Tax=Roseisolibacter agri TaxID=2014610 RepID=A0AA37QCH1_9BACT|nr:Crp/Fnr family transcriptional regulator [Roseisolibacter agri]GLC23760.1 cyclic nucleotide-binding protein [Roseisolibacter agri]
MEEIERTLPPHHAQPHRSDEDVGKDDGADATGSAPPAASLEDRHDGVTAAHAAERNHLLHGLPPEDYAWLLPKLRPERLRLKDVLIEPDTPIAAVHFMRTGVGSMIATEQEGGEIEVGTIGNEGLIGLPVVFGAESSTYRVLIQIEGEAWRLSADDFRQAMEERPAVRRRALRYAHAFTDQIAQSVACNRLHTVEERCARWVLMTHDRVDGDAFELTHEFLAVMLGVRRAGVTVALGALQHAGLIRNVRGRIEVLDRTRLMAAACGCYAVTRASYRRLLD